MNENWLEIVSILRPHFDKNSTEDIYQKDVENCLQILGWKRINKTMLTQYTLPIGNNNNIRLDILLNKNGLSVLPIEIKRPSNICNRRQEIQLMSYMRMLRLNIGLYIGEELRLYYDNPEDSLDCICVFSSKIDENNKNGEVICNLLNYSNFNKNEFESFCREKYYRIQSSQKLQKHILNYLSPSNGVNNILSLIKNKFIEDGFDDSIIDSELKLIKLHIELPTEITGKTSQIGIETSTLTQISLNNNHSKTAKERVSTNIDFNENLRVDKTENSCFDFETLNGRNHTDIIQDIRKNIKDIRNLIDQSFRLEELKFSDFTENGIYLINDVPIIVAVIHDIVENSGIIRIKRCYFTHDKIVHVSYADSITTAKARISSIINKVSKINNRLSIDNNELEQI